MTSLSLHIYGAEQVHNDNDVIHAAMKMISSCALRIVGCTEGGTMKAGTEWNVERNAERNAERK